MVSINPIIPGNFKKFSDDSPDFPKDMLKLLDDLLNTVSRDNIKDDAIDKLFDQIAEKYIENKEILTWCEKFDE